MDPVYELIDDREELLSDPLHELPHWIRFLHRAGADLCPYLFDPRGECLLSDGDLAAKGCDEKEIRSIRLMAVDDFHDPVRVRSVLYRCLEGAKADKPWTPAHKRVIRELKHLLMLCDMAMEAGVRVQIS